MNHRITVASLSLGMFLTGVALGQNGDTPPSECPVKHDASAQGECPVKHDAQPKGECPVEHDAPAAQPVAHAGGPPAEELDWRTLEAPLLRNQVELTSRDKFVKAGEAYFTPDSSWIIFQAVPVPPEGQEPDAFYSMYVAKLVRDPKTHHVTGIEKIQRVSPPGSANTCGWFNPLEPYRVMFGSTLVPPSNNQKSGFQVKNRKYKWMFPVEMEVCSRTVPEIYYDMLPPSAGKPEVDFNADVKGATPLFHRPQYDAECSWSSDGELVLYSHVREDSEPGKPDADIYIYDTVRDEHVPIVTADGYDGGPFFSPDERYICFRSDRRGDNLLQLFVTQIQYDRAGRPSGMLKEFQLTDDQNVNWAPYWHPSGKFLVYGTSIHGHHNYEIYAIEFDPTKPMSELRRRRVTSASGADVLPVFNKTGSMMMWTAQRGPLAEGEDRPSSQIWLAETVKYDWFD